jgi:hypothetical protein
MRMPVEGAQDSNPACSDTASIPAEVRVASVVSPAADSLSSPGVKRTREL